MTTKELISKIKIILSSIDTKSGADDIKSGNYIKWDNERGFVIRKYNNSFIIFFHAIHDLFKKYKILGEKFVQDSSFEIYPLTHLDILNDQKRSEEFFSELQDVCNSYNETQKANIQIVQDFLNNNNIIGTIDEWENFSITIDQIDPQILGKIHKLQHLGTRFSKCGNIDDKDIFYIHCTYDTYLSWNDESDTFNATTHREHSIHFIVTQLQHTIDRTERVVVEANETASNHLKKLKSALKKNPLGIILDYERYMSFTLDDMKKLYAMISENKHILSISGFSTNPMYPSMYISNTTPNDQPVWHDLHLEIQMLLERNRLAYNRKLKVQVAPTSSATFAIVNQRANQGHALENSLLTKSSPVPKMLKEMIFGKKPVAEDKGNAQAAPADDYLGLGFFGHPTHTDNRLEQFTGTKLCRNEVARIRNNAKNNSSDDARKKEDSRSGPK